MTEESPRKILDSIHEGLEESALLTALGYDATQGRPGRYLLNNLLERKGYKRAIPAQEPGRLQPRPYRPYPDGWIKAIAKAVTGRADAPLREVIAALNQRPADVTTPTPDKTTL
jgi:hypothetical protein